MVRMQAKIPSSSEALFQRLRRLQVTEGMTWRQVAEALRISVSSIMAIKGGRRRLSEKALYRLEMFEREIAERKSRAERIVDGLLAGEGAATPVVERELKNATKVTLRVEYSNPRAAKSLPKDITLWRPPEHGSEKLRQLFGQTVDVAVILLACLPETQRGEKFLSKLTTNSRVRLTNAALSLVIPEWRRLVAKSTTSRG